jgi:hypothetical protein
MTATDMRRDGIRTIIRAWGAAACGVAGFLLAFAVSVSAASLDLSNLVLNNNDGRIQVRFGLDIPDLTPLYAALAEGAVLAVRMEARLSLKSEYLWDRQVAETSRLTILRKAGAQYVLESAPGGRPIQTPPGGVAPPPLAAGPDLPEVLRRAFGEVALDLGAWDILTRGQAYVLVLGIGLGRGDVSAFWRNALFFWSFDVLPKARYRLDFTY